MIVSCGTLFTKAISSKLPRVRTYGWKADHKQRSTYPATCNIPYHSFFFFCLQCSPRRVPHSIIHSTIVSIHKANCSIVWGEWLSKVNLPSESCMEISWYKSLNFIGVNASLFSLEDSPGCGKWKRLWWHSRTLQRNRQVWGKCIRQYCWYYYLLAFELVSFSGHRWDSAVFTVHVIILTIYIYQMSHG